VRKIVDQCGHMLEIVTVFKSQAEELKESVFIEKYYRELNSQSIPYQLTYLKECNDQLRKERDELQISLKLKDTQLSEELAKANSDREAAVEELKVEVSLI
jgi:uncharacterized protein YbcV (DUF1398 family)